MQYRWGDCKLDRQGSSLTIRGKAVGVSQKQIACIVHLIEQRHRVVPYNELIRATWGRDDVTTHHLSQLVLTVRRALGDSGRAQRMIRTMPGLGYRWVSPVDEVLDAEASVPGCSHVETGGTERGGSLTSDLLADERTAAAESPSDAAIEQSPPAQPAAVRSTLTPSLASQSPGPEIQRWRPRSMAVFVILTAFVVLAFGWQVAHRQSQAPSLTAMAPASAVSAGPASVDWASVSPPPAAALGAIEERMWRGDTEGVRAALVALPPALAESPEAKMLAVRRYIEIRRYDRAQTILGQLWAKSIAAGDTMLQAEVLTLQSLMSSRAGRSGREVFEPAQKAVALLQSAAGRAPDRALGEALSARGTGLLFLGRFEAAVSDLVRARDLLLKDKDPRRATTTRRMLAHAWLRMGRLADALEEFNQIAALSARLHDLSGEVHARNSAIRIQVELLRWDDALANSRRNTIAASRLSDDFHRRYTTRLHALVLANTGYLREAASLIDDTAQETESGSATVSMFRIISGDAHGALTDSAALFESQDSTSNANLILSSQEGALLLWTIAAQKVMAAGDAPPRPSPAQAVVLQRPGSLAGRIARGRWMWLLGNQSEAQAELRGAFAEAERSQRLLLMTLAAEPLIEMLLARGEIAAAEAVLVSLRGTAPDRMDRDYRVNLLSLRVAMANRNAEEIEDAYRKLASVARERRLPARPGRSDSSAPRPRAGNPGHSERS